LRKMWIIKKKLQSIKKLMKIMIHQSNTTKYLNQVNFIHQAWIFRLLIHKQYADLIYYHQIFWLDSLYSQKEQSHFYLNVWPRIFGINLKIKKINMASHSEMQFFQVAKIQILELVYMQAVMIHIEYSLLYLTQ
jgi:hypothetical protein